LGALVDCRCLDGCTGTSGISFSIGRGKSWYSWSVGSEFSY
jgi:hypothetical protein